jgi:hypothetical protein
MKSSHQLSGKNISGDDVIKTVIAAEAKVKRLQQEVTALKKDRDQLLDEYTDMRQRRPVPTVPEHAKVKNVIGGDRVRVSVGDVHGMLMDRAAVDAFLTDLKLLAPDEMVLGGDILECGGWLAKHQPIGFVAACDYSYQEDIAAANWFLDEVQKAAPSAEIFYIEGNHEDRVERWIVDQVMGSKREAQFLYEAFSPQVLLRLEERGIPYYRRSEVYVEGAPRGWIKRGKMFFTHTLGKGKNAAMQAAQKTAGNVTYWCTHREDSATLVFPSVGLVKAFNPGCLCSMQPIWMHSDPTSWSHGYAVDIISKSENFQRLHVPIWRGESLAGAMIERFKS